MRAWALEMEPEGPLIDDLESTLYLIQLCEQDWPAEERLQDHFLHIFQEELRCWTDDQQLWPQPLTLALFRRWFEVRFYGLIDDLAMDAPLRNCPTEAERQRLRALLDQIETSSDAMERGKRDPMS